MSDLEIVELALRRAAEKAMHSDYGLALLLEGIAADILQISIKRKVVEDGQ